MAEGKKISRRWGERLATSEDSCETLEDSYEHFGQQERTRRMVMAAVRLWELRRGLSDS